MSRSVVSQYQEMLRGFFHKVNDGQISQLAKMIIENKGHLYHLGVGKSGNVGKHFSDMLRSISISSSPLCPMNGLHGDLGGINDHDLILCYSRSGNTGELVTFLQRLKKTVTVVGLFSKKECRLEPYCDLILTVPCEPEIDNGFNLMPTSSYIAFSLFTSICFSEIVVLSKITPEEYGVNHPLGAIGKKLLFTVTDVMMPLDKLCLVEPETSVQETLLQMTQKKQDFAVVIKEKKLVGLIQSQELNMIDLENYQTAVIDHANKKPFFLTNPHLKLFQLHQDLYDYIPIVVDGVLVGIVDRNESF